MNVLSLLGKKNLASSCACLTSFQRHNLDRSKLILLSDGSLDDSDRALLDTIPDATVVSSKDVGAQVADILSSRPFLREFHRTHVFGRKLIDIPLLSGEAGFRYLDSDMFFFRDFSGLFDASEPVRRVFAEDVRITIGIRDAWRCGHRFVPRVNSGILQGRPISWDLLEDFLARSTDTRRPFCEQAAWGLLNEGAPAFLIGRDLVYQPSDDATIPANLCTGSRIGFHLAGPRKHLYTDLTHLAKSGLPPVRIQQVRAPEHSSLGAIVMKLLLRLKYAN